jgi:Zn-dependent protease with chaperone function
MEINCIRAASGVLLAFLLLLVTPVYSEEVFLAWDIEELASEDDYSLLLASDEVDLENPRGRRLKAVSRSHIKVLASIMQGIENAAEIDVRFLIIQGDQPNASAGYRYEEPTVFVNFAMLDLLGVQQDEWAALLGHEVAHLKLGHALSNSKREIPLRVIDAAVSVLSTNPIAQAATGLVTTGIDNKFSRDQERQSDYLGVVWAVEAGFGPHGAVSLHRQFSSQPLSIPFLSSHPGSGERGKTLQALADRLAAPKTQAPKSAEELALQALLDRADAGDVGAQYRLGVMYAAGDEVVKNDLQAFKWLSIAASNGREDAYDLLNEVAGRLSGSDTLAAILLVDEWEAAHKR